MQEYFFESSIERLARILAGQYGIQVVFEGNEAMTDGKRIVLPFFQTMTPEFKADLNGYLDHEVAHCRYTGFEQMAIAENQMHRSMLNSVEDIRIERLMMVDYPGTRYNLEPLRAKVDEHHNKIWKKLPQPARLLLNIVQIMRGLEPRIDKDNERYIDLVRDPSRKLNECTSTEEMRKVTQEIMRLLRNERDKEKDEGDGEADPKKDKDSDSSKKGKGKGRSSKDRSTDKGEKSEGDSSGGEEGEDDSRDGRSDSGVPGKRKGEGEDRDAERKTSPLSGSSDAISDFDRALAGDGKPLIKLKDIAAFINDEIKKALKGDKEVRSTMTSRPPEDPIWEGVRSVPVTTRFDKTTDHSGKGDTSSYARLKLDVMPLINPIKIQLERVLKVKEAAKWVGDKEQGRIDTRALSRLASIPGTRRIFKEFAKTETNNVAVEILIDMSGSMRERMKTAKMAAIAMAEALKDINIAFEVTGFNSKPSGSVASYTASLGDTSRFNRTNEALDLHVFKSFDSSSLSGLERVFVGVQNPDGECVVWAAQRLMKRKEKRKILIVLSDGEPGTGDGSRGILCSDLRNKVKLIQKSGIECIGIGIESECVKHFYPDYIVLKDVKDLPQGAMRKLAKIVGG